MQVCLKGALVGRRECEKLAVLTALEQFQYSAGVGAGGWRGEKRVSGEVDVRGRAQAKGAKVIKMIPGNQRTQWVVCNHETRT